MSIQKKSLISTLKTAKKANVATTSVQDGEAKGVQVSSMRLMKAMSLRQMKASNTKSLKAPSFKTVA